MTINNTYGTSATIFYKIEQRIDKDSYQPRWIDVGSVESFTEGEFGKVVLTMRSGATITTNHSINEFLAMLRREN